MSIRVNPDGSFEVTTIDEALELQRRIKGGAPKLNLRSRMPVKANSSEISYDHEIFAKLRPFNGQELDSEKMRAIIEAKDTGGVGPKLYHMKNRIPGLEDILRGRKTPRGIKFWKVKFPS